jgi:hypothetical protein
MSKGGAGKVYFVLYLAVILELLIIFIERDEAEEHLRREQRQAIEIVQTILSQLQTGSGTTGITVSPKDNIVLDEEKPSNNVRNYDVAVSVGDPKATLVAGGRTYRGDDVPLLEYTVSHTPNPDRPVEDLGEDTVDIAGGEKIFTAQLGTDVGGYTQPRQVFGAGIPAENPNNYFYLNDTLTAKQLAAGRRVKMFSVNFKPNRGPGWYRLRFNSQTNKILGIAGGEPSPNDTIRIGNVKLTVKQLRQVQKALAREAKTGEHSQVEKYITTLLTPEAYKSLEENRGFQSFNVRVTKPPAQKPQDPVAEILLPRDTVYWYDAAAFSVPVRLGPAEGSKDMSGGARLVVADPATNRYNAIIDKPQPGITPLVAKASNKEGKIDVSEKTLVVYTPELKGGIEKWRGMKATVSRKYNPTTDWVATAIPEDHYQTVVEIKGREVFNRSGTVFKDAELPADLVVTEAMTDPKDIRMTVYWKPGGTSDRTQWVALMSNQADADVRIKPTKNFSVVYPAPEHVEGFEFTWVISPKSMSKSLGPIDLRQRIAEGRQVPVSSAQAVCTECAEFGINARLVQSDDKWSLQMDVADRSKLTRAIDGHRFEIAIDMQGRGNSNGTGVVVVTTKVGR